MKFNYTLASLACVLLSIPLAVVVWQRRSGQRAVPALRIATYNLALNRPHAGALVEELRGGNCAPARALAEVVQRCAVDVLVVNELDWDAQGEAARWFAEEYLGKSQNGQAPLSFAYRFVGGVNTGVPSGADLDLDGSVGGPGDAYGYGAFPGQYGMAVFSRFPILLDQVRTFQDVLWSAMPDALRPAGYDDATWGSLRLSSKSHWDVPIGVGPREQGLVVHLLVSHPTPPVFDGAEDRNGKRNHDEIRFWTDYLTPGRGEWIVDDAGTMGGLDAQERFVVLGDLNCDPVDGDSRREALQALLAHGRVQDPTPSSAGGTEQHQQQWGSNAAQRGDPAFDTGDFPDAVGGGPGNLRIDYVLPSRNLQVLGSGVFWPASHAPTHTLVSFSDHRLVFVDLAAGI